MRRILQCLPSLPFHRIHRFRHVLRIRRIHHNHHVRRRLSQFPVHQVQEMKVAAVWERQMEGAMMALVEKAVKSLVKAVTDMAVSRLVVTVVSHQEVTHQRRPTPAVVVRQAPKRRRSFRRGSRCVARTISSSST